jgi:hypothetical protein
VTEKFVIAGGGWSSRSSRRSAAAARRSREEEEERREGESMAVQSSKLALYDERITQRKND